MGFFDAKGRKASTLRRRKFKLIRQFGLPEDIVGGSLSLAHRRCGKPNCHCATNEGHPIWLLSYRVDGEKRSLVVPKTQLAKLKPLVKQGGELRDAVAELLSINAQLLHLDRQSQRSKRSRRH
jgi:hypothetical protein